MWLACSRCTPKNRFKGEICLANHDLAVDRHRDLMTHRRMLSMMDHIDGKNSIADIAERLELPIATVAAFVARLRACGLVEAEHVPGGPGHGGGPSEEVAMPKRVAPDAVGSA